MENSLSNNGKHPPSSPQPSPSDPPVKFWRITVVASIAAGLQFGWALQFSLLTPYIQLLGIPHQWASYIWLCGPVSGLIVQPLAGHYSDNCTSRFGRRRPFIASAAVLITLSVLLIGFAADLGRQTGDTLGSGMKPRAIGIFVVGFWVLDVGNNLLMSPCRALLADLSDGEQRKARNANAAFSFFMAVGSVAGYAAGSYSRLYKFLPFTLTEACDTYCANLKTCFLISATLLIVFTALAIFTVTEKPISRDKEDQNSSTPPSFFRQLLTAVKVFPRSMWVLLLVVSLTSLGLFAFILYDTDWMGKEVYGGKVGDGKLYDAGVRTGSLGLMLNSAVGGVTALAILFLVRGGKTANRIWGLSNIMLGLCLAATVLITKEAQFYRRHHSSTGATAAPSPGIKAGALALFAVMGLPITIIFTIPFALASNFSSSCGSGQGLTMGVLNIALVVPQLFVSLTSGPWDELFGGGNLPSFVVGAMAAIVAGILVLTLLPTPKSSETLDIEIRH